MVKFKFQKSDIIPIFVGLIVLVFAFYKPATAFSVHLMQNNPIVFYVFLVGGSISLFFGWLLKRLRLKK